MVERVFELRLVHIVLVLSYTDALGVYLHQFGKRVHQSAPDAHGTTYGDILVRKLVACHFRGRIY